MNRKIILISAAVLLMAGALIFGGLTLAMAIQPLSSAYDMDKESPDFVFHVGDEGDVRFTFRETTDNAYLLKLQRRKTKELHFQSSDESVAVVSPEGHVQAVGPGKALISVNADDLSQEVSVLSYVRPEALSLGAGLYTLNVGEDLDIRAAVLPGDAVLFDKIAYSVSDKNILRISPDGRITALAPGQAAVYAQADRLTGETEVRVGQPMTGMEIRDVAEGEVLHIERGDTRAFPVRFYPENTTDARDVIYRLSDPDAGEVDEDGVFTAKGKGPVTLTVSCNGFSDSVELELHVTLGGIQLDHEEMTLDYQTQDQLSWVPVPEDTTDSLSCSYISEDPAVVTVDDNGLVTAIAGGTAAVTVRVNEFEKRCTYTVRVPVTAVNISEGSMTLTAGESRQLSASVYPEFTTEDRGIRWVSDQPDIASVDENGVVHAMAAGKTSVHAVNGEIRNSCLVEVRDPMSPEAIAERIVNFGKQYIGTRYVLGGNSLTGGLDCSSFTMQCYASQGISLPRYSFQQVNVGAPVPMDASQWRIGDLVFYSPEGGVSHVAIYIGDGQILHAAQSVGSVNITPYNYNGFTPSAVRRYF